jgi:hypothetical protein
MKKLIASVLLACVCVGCDRPALAKSPAASAEGPAVVDTFKSAHDAGRAATSQGSRPLTA